MTFDAPVKKKLRPLLPPVTLKVTANDVVSTNVNATARLLCTSVSMVGSVGLSDPVPCWVDLNVLP